MFTITDRFKPDEPQYQNALTVNLPIATNDTAELLRYAMPAVEALYGEGYHYKKAEVHLLDLAPASFMESNLFDAPERRERSDRLMQVMDAVNRRYGSETLRFAATGVKRDWQMKSVFRSPRFTSHWNELLVVG